MRVRYRWEIEREDRIVRSITSEFDLRLLRPNQLKALLEAPGSSSWRGNFH
jgi:hypothetical protein